MKPYKYSTEYPNGEKLQFPSWSDFDKLFAKLLFYMKDWLTEYLSSASYMENIDPKLLKISVGSVRMPKNPKYGPTFAIKMPSCNDYGKLYYSDNDLLADMSFVNFAYCTPIDEDNKD